jgi:hypothetical protein
MHNVYLNKHLTNHSKKLDKWCSLGLRGLYPYNFSFYLNHDDEEETIRRF